MKKSLTELLCACDGQKPIASCPIIESLSGCPRCRDADRAKEPAGVGSRKGP